MNAFTEGHAAKKWREHLPDFGSELDHEMLWGGASGTSQPLSSLLPPDSSPATLDEALPLPGPQFPHSKMEALG